MRQSNLQTLCGAQNHVIHTPLSLCNTRSIKRNQKDPKSLNIFSSIPLKTEIHCGTANMFTSPITTS